MNSSAPTALVLTGYGINCERETAEAFRRAGAAPRLMHLNDLIAAPDTFEQAAIFAVPGGFSFGDDVASGRILANRLRYRLGDALRRFVSRGGLVIGICNGFQVLVKMGLLPGGAGTFTQTVTLTHNDNSRFDNRWVHLAAPAGQRCVWLEGIGTLALPIRHGEGKFIARDAATLESLHTSGQVALRYVQPGGAPAGGVWPYNPNGSQDDIAGICDPTGRVFGLMPHPEAYVEHTQHPRWTREDLPEEGAGLAIFRNGIAHARASVTA